MRPADSAEARAVIGKIRADRAPKTDAMTFEEASAVVLEARSRRCGVCDGPATYGVPNAPTKPHWRCDGCGGNDGRRLYIDEEVRRERAIVSLHEETREEKEFADNEIERARAALRDAAQIIEDLLASSSVSAVDLASDMTPGSRDAMRRWLAGDHSAAVTAAGGTK